MEDILKAYLMFLGRPWFKQVKVHHDWGNDTSTIIVDTKIVKLSIEKQVMVHPSQRPCNLNDTYDWEKGIDEWRQRMFIPCCTKVVAC
jgi:hypothetical protein